MVTVEVRTRRTAQLTRASQRVRNVIARDPVVFGAICLVAFCFYLYALGKPAIWYDESFSAIYAIQPMSVFWDTYKAGELNMAFYYLILHGWVHFLAWFGVTATELVLRLPSAAFSALSAGVVFLLGRRFAGMTAGVAAAILYLFNRYSLDAAHQARSYGLQLLLVCLAWYALLALVSGSARKQWWAVYVAMSALAVGAHLVSLLMLPAQVGALCLLCIIPSRVQARARSLLVRFAGAYVVIGLLIIPLLSVSGKNPTHTLWLSTPELRDVPRLYINYISSGGAGPARLVVGAALFAGLVAWAISRSAWGRRLAHHLLPVDGTNPAQHAKQRNRVPFVVALVCWLVIPVLASFVASRVTAQHMFSDRYLIAIVPALDLLLGVGISALEWRWMRVGVLLGMLAGTLVGVPDYYATAQIQDWRTPTNWLTQRYQRGDGVVCQFRKYVPGCHDYEFEYYLYYFHASGIASDVAADLGPDSTSANSWDGLAAYGATHSRVFFVAGDFADYRDEEQARAMQHWLDSHYHLIEAMSNKDGTIRLYATGAGPSALRGAAMPADCAASRVAWGSPLSALGQTEWQMVRDGTTLRGIYGGEAHARSE